MNNIIETKKLCKSFSSGGVQQHVLRNLDLQIREGDFTVIMGPSGAGKSTLLYALSGMDKPTLGQVIFSGDWDGHFGPKFSAGRRSFQLSTFDDLTVWSIKEGDTEQAYMLPVNSGAGETAETVVSDVSGDAATNTGVETYE